MKKRLLVAGALVTALAAVFATAADATTTLSLASCVVNGGTRTVPAGDDVVLRTGWLANEPGLVTTAIRDSTITVSENGTPVTGDWGDIEFVPSLDGYSAFWTVDIGPVTTPVIIASTWTLAHPITDLLTFNADGTPFLYSDTLWDGGCTIVPA